MTKLLLHNSVSEIELVYNPKVASNKLFQVVCAHDAYEAFMSVWDQNIIAYIEEFKVMYLNQGGRVLGIVSISKGGITQTLADVRVILGVALKCSSVSLILCHNHPTMRMRASDSDVRLTKKIVEAASFMEINVQDHLIISKEGYYSMAEEGNMPEPSNK